MSDSGPDVSDIVLGVLLALGIPLATVFGLGAIGMPVSGKQGVTWEESLRIKEALEEVDPPLQPEELTAKLARVDALLTERSAEYHRRSRAEEDPILKDRYQKLALSVLGICEADLKTLRDQVEKSDAIANSASDIQAIDRRLLEIARIRGELDKEKVFHN